VCFLDRVLFLFHQRDSERNKLDGKALDEFFGCFLEQIGVVRFDTGMDRECAVLVDTRRERPPVLCAYTPVGLSGFSLCLLR